MVTHCFAPAHIIPLIEVVPGPETTSELTDFSDGLMRRIGERKQGREVTITGAGTAFD